MTAVWKGFDGRRGGGTGLGSPVQGRYVEVLPTCGMCIQPYPAGTTVVRVIAIGPYPLIALCYEPGDTIFIGSERATIASRSALPFDAAVDLTLTAPLATAQTYRTTSRLVKAAGKAALFVKSTGAFSLGIRAASGWAFTVRQGARLSVGGTVYTTTSNSSTVVGYSGSGAAISVTPSPSGISIGDAVTVIDDAPGSATVDNRTDDYYGQTQVGIEQEDTIGAVLQRFLITGASAARSHAIPNPYASDSNGVAYTSASVGVWTTRQLLGGSPDTRYPVMCPRTLPVGYTRVQNLVRMRLVPRYFHCSYRGITIAAGGSPFADLAVARSLGGSAYDMSPTTPSIYAAMWPRILLADGIYEHKWGPLYIPGGIGTSASAILSTAATFSFPHSPGFRSVAVGADFWVGGAQSYTVYRKRASGALESVYTGSVSGTGYTHLGPLTSPLGELCEYAVVSTTTNVIMRGDPRDDIPMPFDVVGDGTNDYSEGGYVASALVAPAGEPSVTLPAGGSVVMPVSKTRYARLTCATAGTFSLSATGATPGAQLVDEFGAFIENLTLPASLYVWPEQVRWLKLTSGAAGNTFSFT